MCMHVYMGMTRASQSMAQARTANKVQCAPAKQRLTQSKTGVQEDDHWKCRKQTSQS